MFNFLKDKLKKAVEKFSKNVEDEAEVDEVKEEKVQDKTFFEKIKDKLKTDEDT